MPVKAMQEVDIDTRLANVLAHTGVRDRVNIDKHLAICDAEPDSPHAVLWRRLFVKLGELAPLPVHTVRTQITQFYVADGKYRMQVFALEDNCDGFLTIYLPNIMAKAVSEKLLLKHGERYSLPGASKEVLATQQMDVNNPSDPPEHVKHMVGWNRKAVKFTLPIADPDGPQVILAESLCELAARQWAGTP